MVHDTRIARNTKVHSSYHTIQIPNTIQNITTSRSDKYKFITLLIPSFTNSIQIHFQYPFSSYYTLHSNPITFTVLFDSIHPNPILANTIPCQAFYFLYYYDVVILYNPLQYHTFPFFYENTCPILSNPNSIR